MAFPYQKHIWVTREVIRRDYLQNIEDGIYDEQEDRLTVEERLRSDLVDEIARATDKEYEIANNLTAEITRATAAEAAIQASISSMESIVDDVEAIVDTEKVRAETAESQLSTAITGVSGDLSNEITRATTAEDSLRDYVDATENNLKDYVDEAVKYSSGFRGSITFEELPLPIVQNKGAIYNITNSFTTTLDFLEGAGIKYPAGTDVAIVEDNDQYKYDALAGDTSNLVKNTDYASEQKAGVIKIDGETITMDQNGVAHIVIADRVMEAAESAEAAAREATLAKIAAVEAAEDSTDNLTEIRQITSMVDFQVDFITGMLNYNSLEYEFLIDTTSGQLQWGVVE